MKRNAFELNCEVRTDKGKGASRRLRRLQNAIPAVLYGGEQDTLSLTIKQKDISLATENEAFFAHIITLNIGKEKQQAVIKDLQRHPAKPIILHADFQRVMENVAITINVPIHFINEDKCNGVKLGGGNILKSLNEIEISCLPKDLPEYIEVDTLNLEIGDSIHLSDIKLPAGVTSVALSHGPDMNHIVAAVHAPRAEAAEPAAAEVPAAEVKTVADDKKEKSGDKEK